MVANVNLGNMGTNIGHLIGRWLAPDYAKREELQKLQQQFGQGRLDHQVAQTNELEAKAAAEKAKTDAAAQARTDQADAINSMFARALHSGQPGEVDDIAEGHIQAMRDAGGDWMSLVPSDIKAQVGRVANLIDLDALTGKGANLKDMVEAFQKNDAYGRAVDARTGMNAMPAAPVFAPGHEDGKPYVLDTPASASPVLPSAPVFQPPGQVARMTTAAPTPALPSAPMFVPPAAKGVDDANFWASLLGGKAYEPYAVEGGLRINKGTGETSVTPLGQAEINLKGSQGQQARAGATKDYAEASAAGVHARNDSIRTGNDSRRATAYVAHEGGIGNGAAPKPMDPAKEIVAAINLARAENPPAYDAPSGKLVQPKIDAPQALERFRTLTGRPPTSASSTSTTLPSAPVFQPPMMLKPGAIADAQATKEQVVHAYQSGRISRGEARRRLKAMGVG